MKGLTNEITDILIESGAISREERNLYYYCIENLVEITLNLIITITIGLLTGRLTETFLFLLIIIPLRSTVGGYHAESGRVCFILSLLLYLITLFSASIMFEKLDYKYSIFIYVISCVFILLLSPVDCPNKRLNEKEKKRQKKVSFLLVELISIIFVITWIFKINHICFLISCCVASVTVLLIAGIIKNTVKNKTTPFGNFK